MNENEIKNTEQQVLQTPNIVEQQVTNVQPQVQQTQPPVEPTIEVKKKKTNPIIIIVVMLLGAVIVYFYTSYFKTIEDFSNLNEPTNEETNVKKEIEEVVDNKLVIEDVELDELGKNLKQVFETIHNETTINKITVVTFEMDSQTGEPVRNEKVITDNLKEKVYDLTYKIFVKPKTTSLPDGIGFVMNDEITIYYNDTNRLVIYPGSEHTLSILTFENDTYIKEKSFYVQTEYLIKDYFDQNYFN